MLGPKPPLVTSPTTAPSRSLISVWSRASARPWGFSPTRRTDGPSAICFEVTEAAILSNVQHAQRFIEVLHGIGCEFSLDDFGSGLGSFSSLKHLPVDYLKIDGTYTRNLRTDPVNQEIVAAMVKLARTMQFRIVAEQVEHQDDFDWLRDSGVDFVQGYFIEAPTRLGTTPSTGTFRILNP